MSTRCPIQPKHTTAEGKIHAYPPTFGFRGVAIRTKLWFNRIMDDPDTIYMH